MKTLGKKIVLGILSKQLRQLQGQWHPKVIAVVGSYGKTSTKFAIATTLEKQFRVRFQQGNYNDIVTVPLVFFGEPLVSLRNPLAWLRLFMRNRRQLKGPAPYDIVVLELGTDTPGDIARFGRYLHADVAVVTSIAYEHMEFFRDLRAVAEEELAVAAYSNQLLVNTDLCAPEYLNAVKHPLSYAIDAAATYQARDIRAKGDSFDFTIYKDSRLCLRGQYHSAARSHLYSAVAAAAVGDLLGERAENISAGIATIIPVAGRMQRLKGIRGSTILDESYNASPSAMRAAIDALYAARAPQKIALLGSMNELGDYSEQTHTEVGAYCDPAQLDLVLTLGLQANQFLAPAARARGCRVITCQSPYEAGKRLRVHIKRGAIILVKGSQNGVFTEEAIKAILQNPDDAHLLVRQSGHWLAKKHQQFPDFPQE